ncbi:Hypothetical predicted protein [Mytilus galloprovincialis]|uniref:C1q domain-containing protein n=1 Tax=Mytilus galloprovincialis TaxID=29158 RepID=A0A8B6D222_MYTGA|nr:Hypothetical predicted protein [Mytilus galloprovincialis]
MVDIIWLFLLPTTFGFLFDLTTPGPLNGGLTNSHYNALLDIITEERKARKQMGLYISQLEMEVKKLTNITSIIHENYENVRSELRKEQSKSLQLKNCCSYIRNSTFKITDSTHKQNDTNRLAKVLETTQYKVNMLLRNERARQEDFLALYNLTLNNQNTVARMNAEAQFREKELRKYTDEGYHNLSVAFEIVENKIESVVMVIQDKLTRESEQVAVTACAASDSYNNRVIRFPDFKTSYEINNPSALKTLGQFICDKPGLYTIIPSMMSNTPNAEYQIRKNGIALVYIRMVPNYSDSNQLHYTGTGSAVVFLNKADILDIKTVTDTFIHGPYSCLSIIKIH